MKLVPYWAKSWSEFRYYAILKPRERVVMWVAWHLPRKLVMRAYCRVGAYATTGKWSSTVTTEITMMEALRRWNL